MPSRVKQRPPTRSRASRITVSIPRSARARAAPSPASPAPTTTTRRTSCGIPCPLTSSATDALTTLSFGGRRAAPRAPHLVGQDHGDVEGDVGGQLAGDDAELPAEEPRPHSHRERADDEAVEQLGRPELEQQPAGGAQRAERPEGDAGRARHAPLGDELAQDDGAVE